VAPIRGISVAGDRMAVLSGSRIEVRAKHGLTLESFAAATPSPSP
jgi:hypothetical protein